jgi:ribonuclease-3
VTANPSDPVIVFRTASDIEAWVVRGLLDAHGIHTMMSADTPRSIFPVAVSGLGEVSLVVRADDADEARQVIDEYRTQADPRRVVSLRDEFFEVETRIGYRFRDRGLLEQALTHRSRAQEDVTGGVADNEALEFLGDAVLGFIVADLLYREFPDYDEGRKSKIKAAVVSRPVLARIGERLDLGAALILGRGEEKTGGRQKGALLADGCEALIAAIYLDGGIEPARDFVLRELAPLLERARRPGLLTAFTGDYKSALQEFMQAREAPPPEYRLVTEAGPAHRRYFEVQVWAEGRCLAAAQGMSKKQAEQAAAAEALRLLGVEVVLTADTNT